MRIDVRTVDARAEEGGRGMRGCSASLELVSNFLANARRRATSHYMAFRALTPLISSRRGIA